MTEEEGAQEIMPAPTLLPGDAPDIFALLLADKRSAHTRRAYAHDLKLFFLASYGAEPSERLLREFLALTTARMARLIVQFKAGQVAAQRSEATVNRRLAAILSLVRLARRVGATDANPEDVIVMERARAYRDTRGIEAEQARHLLQVPNRDTPKGRRDYALLLLLLENALRRSEICALRVSDFDSGGSALMIHGKGRGTQQERVTLSAKAAEALRACLRDISPPPAPEDPLFVNFSPAYAGRALTPDGLYKIVRALAGRAGLEKLLSPHRLRHTSITLALDASGGNIRRVQKLSRHARLETLQVYDDNRQDLQGEMSRHLSQLLDDAADG